MVHIYLVIKIAKVPLLLLSFKVDRVDQLTVLLLQNVRRLTHSRTQRFDPLHQMPQTIMVLHDGLDFMLEHVVARLHGLLDLRDLFAQLRLNILRIAL
jgi:hypothetical protein